MAISIKLSIVSLKYTYELQGNRLTIIDNSDNDETLIIEGTNFKDLKEFLNY